jgi:hypothetical protein
MRGIELADGDPGDPGELGETPPWPAVSTLPLHPVTARMRTVTNKNARRMVPPVQPASYHSIRQARAQGNWGFPYV